MSTDTESAGRSDHYATYMFMVRGAGRLVAGFSSLTHVPRTAALGEPGPSETDDSEALALERGASEDNDFVGWAVRGERAPRMDLDVEVHDEAGRLVLTYRARGCWVSEFESLPDLDGDANAVRIGHLRLENDGWETIAAPEPEEITVPEGEPTPGVEVSLRPVAEDWRAVGDVRPTDAQRDFVHPMAAGYLLMTERSAPWNSLGIYEGESVVGHVMWGLDEDGSHWIGGLVVDQHAQGRGLGRAAMVALVAWLAEQPGHWVTRLTLHPDNVVAARLYAELGFTPTGETDDEGEAILELRP